jgi:hypothetical protein
MRFWNILTIKNLPRLLIQGSISIPLCGIERYIGRRVNIWGLKYVPLSENPIIMFFGVRNALQNRRLPLGSSVSVAMQNVRASHTDIQKGKLWNVLPGDLVTALK